MLYLVVDFWARVRRLHCSVLLAFEGGTPTLGPLANSVLRGERRIARLLDLPTDADSLAEQVAGLTRLLLQRTLIFIVGQFTNHVDSFFVVPARLS